MPAASLAYLCAYAPMAYLSALFPASRGITAVGVALCMIAVWTIMGYWRRIVFTPLTVLCGICTAVIIKTTLDAYGIKGSPVTMLATVLLLRGGVLVIAPPVDLIDKRPVSAGSWAALALSLAAIGVISGGSSAGRLDSRIIGILTAYCVAYAVKLHLFTPVKKSSKAHTVLISEQTVAVTLYVGYTLFTEPVKFGGYQILIGMFSQLTGLFGGMILLSKEGHAACVPMNRAASIIAGLIATYALGKTIKPEEKIGFALLMIAILALQGKEMLAFIRKRK